MRYASVCSGVEAASLAWHHLGWEPVWFAEIEKFPSQVLKHRFPDVPNLGDMTKLNDNTIFQNTDFDLLVGGTPCQPFSVAGLRAGLADERGNLALEFCRILLAKRPKYFVWENVPGVLSSNKGEDFATLLQAFRECGYCCAYRVLDAKYFGVPQRRRRVFVVGCLGNDWRPPAEILFEPESLSGDYPKGGKQGQETTGDARKRPQIVGTTVIDRAAFNQGTNALYDPYIALDETNPCLIKRGPNAVSYGIPGNWIGRKPENGGNAVEPMEELSPCQTKTDRHAVAHGFRTVAFGKYDDDGTASTMKRQDYKNATGLAVHCFKEQGGCEGGGKGYMGKEEVYTISTSQDQAITYAFDETQITSPTNASIPRPNECHTLSKNGRPPTLLRPVVRRLTPLECERLMGFPDNWTNIPGASDTARYAACGNSMAVPVMKWIGERIHKVNKKYEQQI